MTSIFLTPILPSIDRRNEMAKRSFRPYSTVYHSLYRWLLLKITTTLLIYMFFHPGLAIALPAADIAAFKDKRVKSFSTSGHSKAKGISLRLKYPATWPAEEAERPNIVQKFRTEYKGHSVGAAVTILNLPNSQRLTKEEANNIICFE